MTEKDAETTYQSNHTFPNNDFWSKNKDTWVGFTFEVDWLSDPLVRGDMSFTNITAWEPVNVMEQIFPNNSSFGVFEFSGFTAFQAGALHHNMHNVNLTFYQWQLETGIVRLLTSPSITPGTSRPWDTHSMQVVWYPLTTKIENPPFSGCSYCCAPAIPHWSPWVEHTVAQVNVGTGSPTFGPTHVQPAAANPNCSTYLTLIPACDVVHNLCRFEVSDRTANDIWMFIQRTSWQRF